MAQGDGDSSSDIFRVSDALTPDDAGELSRARLEAVELWLLIDANRWGIVAGLAAVVFAALVLAVVFGPVPVAGYLFGGTVISKGYVEL